MMQFANTVPICITCLFTQAFVLNLFIYLVSPHSLQDLSSPTNLCPLLWKHRFLTTGPPGKPPNLVLRQSNTGYCSTVLFKTSFTLKPLDNLCRHLMFCGLPFILWSLNHLEFLFKCCSSYLCNFLWLNAANIILKRPSFLHCLYKLTGLNTQTVGMGLELEVHLFTGLIVSSLFCSFDLITIPVL